MTAALGSGSWRKRSSRTSACHGSPRLGTRRATAASARIGRRPKVRPSISGVKATAQPSSALSSTGISITMPRRRSGARAAASSVVLAPSDVPITTASGGAQVVEQRHDLAAELGHRVAVHVHRPVRRAVPEQVERDHPMAAIGERARQLGVHPTAEQEPVQEHRQPRPVAV